MGTGFRIGIGYDVHRLVGGRDLILGGVRMEHELGLLGHSDADVLCHAVTDAVLGALGKGDIGRHFPDDDPAFRGADSRDLLRRVWANEAEGWAVGNIDAILIAEAPKLAPFVAAMAENLAEDLGCEPSRINIKATTHERLGALGRREGIAAQAVALLERV